MREDAVLMTRPMKTLSLRLAVFIVMPALASILLAARPVEAG